MKENKAREERFIEYKAKTIYPESVNQLDFNGGHDSRDKEVDELKAIITEDTNTITIILKHFQSVLEKLNEPRG